jgi:hypothetical protein
MSHGIVREGGRWLRRTARARALARIYGQSLRAWSLRTTAATERLSQSRLSAERLPSSLRAAAAAVRLLPVACIAPEITSRLSLANWSARAVELAPARISCSAVALRAAVPSLVLRALAAAKPALVRLDIN